MAIRYINPADLFRQMEMDMLRHADPSLGTLFFQPAVDIFETDDSLVIRMELPGVKTNKLQIELSADDKTLTISGERLEGEENRGRIRCHHLEIFYGAFQREINLPASVPFDRETITANYRDGLLSVFMPKVVQKPIEKRTIAISSEDS